MLNNIVKICQSFGADSKVGNFCFLSYIGSIFFFWLVSLCIGNKIKKPSILEENMAKKRDKISKREEVG